MTTEEKISRDINLLIGKIHDAMEGHCSTTRLVALERVVAAGILACGPTLESEAGVLGSFIADLVVDINKYRPIQEAMAEKSSAAEH